MNSLQDEFTTIASLDLEPIKVKIMHQESGEGWSLERANAVEFEYRRFLYLMKKYPEENAAPSMDVDTFWHYHILDTLKYAVDCETVFGHFLHHFPYLGLRGEDDLLAHQQVGERMATLYEETFGERYPFSAASDSASEAAASTAFSVRPSGAAFSVRASATAFSVRASATAFSVRASTTAFSVRPSAVAFSVRASGTAFSVRTVGTSLQQSTAAPSLDPLAPEGAEAAYAALRAATAFSVRVNAHESARAAADENVSVSDFFSIRPRLSEQAVN